MKDRNISHYRILDEIGRGGMGVVYRAEDTKLQRTVALKFLPPELTSDNEAKQRLLREARVASGLDHPNLCSIHEIDESPDGQLFVAMAFYEGETLKKRMARGAIPLDEALDIAIQVAQGLRKAHEAGIVHRDIKPANVFITTDGIVKILDFGVAIAKLSGQTRLTRTGTTPGTIAYVSPEQIKGADADERSDLWGLGVVLYEMVTGHYPFRGENEAALLHAVLNETPKQAQELLPGSPRELDAILTRVLAKDPSGRYASAGDLRKDLGDLQAQRTSSRPVMEQAGISRLLRKPQFAVPAVILLVAALSGAGWAWTRASNARWAREQAIPEIAQLVNQGSYDRAFFLAEQAKQYTPDDPMLRTLTPQFAMTVNLTTDPPDADVYVRPYEAITDEWRHLGRTPLSDIQLPRRPFRWKIEKQGFEPTEFAATGQEDRLANNRPTTVPLQAVGSRPPDMVFVPGGQSTMRLVGSTLGPIDLPAYFLDRLEVTNKAFKEFVDAGYGNRSYWEDLDFVKDGKPLTWEQAMAVFVDSTGRPGPATWELGDYASGRDDYPVTGVSWFEAMAYAKYRGKQLPSVYHWTKAALPESEMAVSLATSLVPLSNFGSSGPARVGSHQALGPYGTYDMQGNVKEWAFNRGPSGGWLLGGGWNDQDYFYAHALAASLFDRSTATGFRLMKETEPGKTARNLWEQVNLKTQRDVTTIKPASNEVFEVYRRFLSYSPGELNATTPKVVQTTDDWTKELITINTGYRNERMDVYLYIPRRGRGPFQPVIYFPGYGVFQIQRPSSSYDPANPGYPLDYIIKANRVLVQPIYQGTYERWNGVVDVTDEMNYPRKMVDWRWDIGRTLDYLQTRKDIDASRIGYVGTSFGGSYALPLLATESRIKAAVLMSGGLTTQESVPPIADCINYAPRITIPVLMINGKFDNFFGTKTSQEPLFALLGTPPKDKRYEALEFGHAFAPRDKLIQETLGWLDKYLGPVQ